jgi:hypothetical protein
MTNAIHNQQHPTAGATKFTRTIVTNRRSQQLPLLHKTEMPLTVHSQFSPQRSSESGLALTFRLYPSTGYNNLSNHA